MTSQPRSGTYGNMADSPRHFLQIHNKYLSISCYIFKKQVNSSSTYGEVSISKCKPTAGHFTYPIYSKTAAEVDEHTRLFA